MAITVNDKDLGMVTAYAYALAGGYTGTEAEFEALLGNIAKDLAEIENLSVQVQTLPAGSDATASYAEGVLTLGIPRGDKGETGDQGEIGPTPQLSVGTVTTGEPGTDAEVEITGTPEAPVLNFTIPRGDTGNITQAVRYDAAQTLTDAEKEQARANIDAADAGEVADVKNTYIGDIGEIESNNMTNIASMLTENSGVISGTVGSEISIVPSNSYIYYKVPCDALKHFCVFTREENNNPSYIIETDAANVVTKAHTNNANKTPYYEVYSFDALDESAYLYVMCYIASGGSNFTEIYCGYGAIVHNIENLMDRVGNLYGTETLTDDVTYILPITAGGIKGDLGTGISTTTTSSYAYCAIDCSEHKRFRITTRRSNSATYPAYVYEAKTSTITKIYTGNASTSNDVYTYEIEAGIESRRLYVLMYRGGGGSGYVPEIYRYEDTVEDIIKSTKADMQAEELKIAYLSDNAGLTYEALETSILQTGKNKVLGLNRAAGEKLVNFAFITDTHINGYGATVTYAKPSIELFVKLCNEKYVDFGAFGGDMFSDYNLSHDDALNAMGEVLTQFGKINIPLLITKGNHECNGKYIKTWDMTQTPEWSTYHYWVLNSDVDPSADGRSYVSVDASTWDGESQLHYSVGTSEGYDANSRFSRDDTIQDWEHAALSALRVNHLVTNNPDDPYGDYYYYDLNDAKIRMIVLNGFNSSSTGANGLEQQVIGTAQMAWITNSALDVPDKATWKVIFITHLHPTENNGQAFYDAIEAFQAAGGKVLAIIHGHQHADTYYTKLSGRDWLLNFIGVQNGYVTNAASIGTSNAYRVSIFTIDTENAKIYETKLGAGTDREFPFAPVTEIPVRWGQG